MRYINLRFTYLLTYDSGAPKKPCIRWGSRYPHVKVAILREKGAAHSKVYGLSAVSCAKTAEPLEICHLGCAL